MVLQKHASALRDLLRLSVDLVMPGISLQTEGNPKPSTLNLQILSIILVIANMVSKILSKK